LKLTSHGGNSTYAGAFAAVMANIVLVAYVVVAMQEDQAENDDGVRKDGKKDQ
jgi:vacuolar ATPase assembly integral membrane protein VMA21